MTRSNYLGVDQQPVVSSSNGEGGLVGNEYNVLVKLVSVNFLQCFRLMRKIPENKDGTPKTGLGLVDDFSKLPRVFFSDSIVNDLIIL